MITDFKYIIILAVIASAVIGIVLGFIYDPPAAEKVEQ